MIANAGSCDPDLLGCQSMETNMSNKFIAANVSDCKLVVRCTQCGTSVALDFSTKDKQGANVPQLCPGGCVTAGHTTTLDESTKNAVDAYRRFIEMALRPNSRFELLTLSAR